MSERGQLYPLLLLGGLTVLLVLFLLMQSRPVEQASAQRPTPPKTVAPSSTEPEKLPLLQQPLVQLTDPIVPEHKARINDDGEVLVKVHRGPGIVYPPAIEGAPVSSQGFLLAPGKRAVVTAPDLGWTAICPSVSCRAGPPVSVAVKWGIKEGESSWTEPGTDITLQPGQTLSLAVQMKAPYCYVVVKNDSEKEARVAAMIYGRR